MDDLLALFDVAVAEQPEEPCPTNTPPDSSAPPSQPNTQRKRGSLPLQQTNDSHQLSVSADRDLCGIRMINRKISSSDLMHRMIDDPFHGTAQLCAASLSTLNSLLVEPTTILDVATVNGKTHLWTMGIVFSNTGSRIGPSGKAYSMLTIGTLTTGPSITIN